MYHVMFDIDGTLIKSMEFDSQLFTESLHLALENPVNTNWSEYEHVTDTGIIKEIANTHGRNDAHAIEQRVKTIFFEKMEQYLLQSPAQQIQGAAEFIDYLLDRGDVELSVATGGWRESALLKLRSAGLFRECVPVATCNDHFSRTEIMKTAKSQMKSESANQTTYFGDAIWDRKACKSLNYNFILVGRHTSHPKQIDDYRDFEKTLQYIGL